MPSSGRRLRKALDVLQQFDSRISANSLEAERATRAELLAEAGEAFWSYVVQRETLGLMDADYIAQEYQVPLDVKLWSGPKRSSDARR